MEKQFKQLPISFKTSYGWFLVVIFLLSIFFDLKLSVHTPSTLFLSALVLLFSSFYIAFTALVYYNHQIKFNQDQIIIQSIWRQKKIIDWNNIEQVEQSLNKTIVQLKNGQVFSLYLHHYDGENALVVQFFVRLLSLRKNSVDS
ncbi:MAG: hypothetical protein MK212_22335 [Saprospiraceae bacterium]|nr:hypothetical protein [Saprospiraceae bacterium]